jgi:outer membrane lipoprotein LolB
MPALRIALAGSVVLLALAGCRTAPPAAAVIGPGADAPWPEQNAALRKLDRYSLSGRVAVAANGQGFSGSLRYQQQEQRAQLSLDGPMGIGGMRVSLDGENVSITTSRGENLDGSAARAELEQQLGFELPLTQLRWWFLCMPEPGPGEIIVDSTDAGEPLSFDQDGWHVSASSRMPALGFSLPQRLTIEREGARLKLVVDRWQP